MTHPPSPSPADPVCILCSKPIRFGGFVHTYAGQYMHIRCRSQKLHLTVLDEGERARRAVERATSLIRDAARRRQTVPLWPLPRRDRCPLCGALATLTSWRPQFEWMGVEGCTCGGFFVTSFVVTGVLPDLAPSARQEVIRHVQAQRATRREVWLTTTDGTSTGDLVTRGERPDRAL
jgi:hypothetical protein